MNETSSDDEEKDFLNIVATATIAIALYYETYIHKSPCMISYQTGFLWLNDIMEGHETRCLDMFRIKKDTLLLLCEELQVKHNLKTSRNMSILEKVCICLYILAQGASNRHAQERFQHSGETISRIFKEVLDSICSLAQDVIRPVDPEFTNISPKIKHDQRYMPYFKDCIGAIDGTHVHAHVKPEDQVRFIGRKGIPTQNVMAASSFDMQFTFVLAGWEGTAHDTRIFFKAINSTNLNFPKPPISKLQAN
ncbi:hypothetical protein M5689_006555 [Euphorbia peplus]|nr:hypothetical protein M5689_006555 [Euphorbia peplus]